MLWLDILLVAIGLLAVYLSYRNVDVDKENTLPAGISESNTVEADRQIGEEIQRATEQVEKILEQRQEETINDVSEQLAHLSNEKIIAVGEYGDQILDKIQKNHSEVVFLYNMLNEKENEIKEVIHSLDKKKAELSDYSAKVSYELKQDIRKVESRVSKLSVKDVMEMTTDATVKVQEEEKEILEQEEKEMLLEPSGIQRLKSGKSFSPGKEKQTISGDVQESKKKNTSQEHQYFQIPGEPDREEELPEDKDYKEEIIGMYNEGRSILDISRELKIGQGEVKFVIDLYGRE